MNEHQTMAAEDAGGTQIPQEMVIFTVQGTPFLIHPSDIPGQAAIFWAFLQLATIRGPRLLPPVRWLQAAIWLWMYRSMYTLHSIGHIMSARLSGAPMDAVSWRWGTQVNVYKDSNVTPDQHIGRAAGGPVITALTTLEAYLVWRTVRRIPGLRWLARWWLAFNAIGLAVALAPTPTFDGGALLKWGVTRFTGEEALGEEAVRQAGFATAAGVIMAGLALMMRRKWLPAFGCIGFALYMIADLTALRGKRP
jgi:hypothetical protein